ncbi:MAG: hypothetical protein IEMM0003_0128 [bacterium]|nr:MAG: hypothetical protein IEMM0003_0128 [bacterium]
MHIIDTIQKIILPNISHLGIWGYWILFSAALLETILIVGLFMPGSTIVLIFGALAANGYYDFGDLMWFAVIAALIGDNINYYIGRKYGYSWAKNKRFIKEKHFEKGRYFFNTYGAKALFLGRLIPGLKETFPFIAGSVKMDMRKFLFWDLLGCIAWSLEFLSVGYLFGSSLSLARAWLGHLTLLLAFIFLLFVLFYMIKFLIIKDGKSIWQFQKSLFYSIKENPDVEAFTKKHSKLFDFLAKRVDRKKFSGLPLTLLSISFVYLFIAFIGTLLDVMHFGQIAQFDLMFSNLLASFRSLSLVKLFLFITMLGNTKTIIIISLAVLIILIIHKKHNYILPLSVTVIFTVLSDNLIKYLVGRQRPLAAVYHESFYSFPSGHAAIAVAFYGFIAYILIREIKNLKSRLNIAFAAFLIIFLTGLSRIYLSVHYFSDVWAGYMLGALWVITGIAISEYYLFKHKNGSSHTINPSVKIVSIALIVLSLSGYAYLGYTFKPELLKLPQIKTVPIDNITTIFKNKKLKYTYTIIGARQEPVNFIIVAKSDKELLSAIRNAGWYLADKLNLNSVERFMEALISSRPYNKASISPDFWDYRVNNFGIEKPTKSVKVRHHGRIWKTPFTINGERIYVAALSFDEGFRWIVHKISPYVDNERDFFFKNLKNNGLIKKYRLIRLTKPFTGKNFYGDQFFTDGKAYIVWIKNSKE